MLCASGGPASWHTFPLMPSLCPHTRPSLQQNPSHAKVLPNQSHSFIHLLFLPPCLNLLPNWSPVSCPLSPRMLMIAGWSVFYVNLCRSMRNSKQLPFLTQPTEYRHNEYTLWKSVTSVVTSNLLFFWLLQPGKQGLGRWGGGLIVKVGKLGKGAEREVWLHMQG